MFEGNGFGNGSLEDRDSAAIEKGNDRVLQVRTSGWRRRTDSLFVFERVRADVPRRSRWALSLASLASPSAVLDRKHERGNSRNHPRQSAPRPDVLRADRIDRAALLPEHRRQSGAIRGEKLPPHFSGTRR